MRILVCGGRNFADGDLLNRTLDKYTNYTLIEGGASGADLLAKMYAFLRDIPVMEFKANWEKYGKKAGYLRNKQMLEEGKPDLVIAFPGGKGTANMKKLARESEIPILDPF